MSRLIAAALVAVLLAPLVWAPASAKEVQDRRQLMDSLRVRDEILGRGKKSPKAPKPQEDFKDSGPMRLLMVTVTDQEGNPVPEADVMVVTPAEGRFQEGTTSGQGDYLTEVRCYVPGLYESMLHKVRVTSPLGMSSQTFTTNPDNCGFRANLTFILEGSASEEEEQIRKYRRRQRGYEEEEMPPANSPYRDPWEKREVDPWEKRYPQPTYPGQYRLPGQQPPGQPGPGKGY